MFAPFVFPCPSCGQNLKVERAQTYKCPKCGKLVSVRADVPNRSSSAATLCREPSSEILSLDDHDQSTCSRSPGRTTAVAIVVALFVVCGVAAGVYFSLNARPRIDNVEAPAAKESPTNESPPNKHVEKPVAPEPPKSVPQTPTVTTFLPEPERPQELSGDEVYRQLLRSSAFIVTSDGLGSGVLIDVAQRLVLTNAHVVDDSRRVIVLFPIYDNDHQVITDAKHYVGRAKEVGQPATVLVRSVKQDLALVRVERLPANVRAVRISQFPASTGSSVYSIGGSGANDDLLWRLSTGTVRGRARKEYRDSQGIRDAMILETQSPINRGDSGGPVVNGRAELVGIVAAYDRAERLVSLNIDLTEVRSFVDGYFRSIGQTWRETDRELQTSPNLPGSDAVFNNLIAVLKGGVPSDRVTAARRLGNLRHRAKPAIPALLATLHEADPELQVAITTALTQIGAPELGAEKVLLDALRSKSPFARNYAIKLFSADTPVPAGGENVIVSLLQDTSAEIRSLAATALGKQGSTARSAALGPLLERLADDNQIVRDTSAAALKLLGPPERSERNVLLALINHKDLRVRVAALGLLRPLATTVDDIRTIWLPLLKDSDSQLRLASVTSLTATNELLKSVEREVIPLLSDPDPQVRRTVAFAARLVNDKDGIREMLARRLESEADSSVKEALAGSLISVTPADQSALPLLRTCLKDPSATVREAAARKIALLAQDAAPAVPDLIDRIGDDVDAVRTESLKTLAAMGRSAKDAIQPAARLFDRQTPEPVLVAAVRLLAATGPDGMARLEAVCQKSLPQRVREEMCRSFSRTKGVGAAAMVWMIEQAETLADCREAITDSVATSASKIEVQELLRRTLPTKPRQPGEKPVANPTDYRVWAIVTLRKLDYSVKELREARETVVSRLELLASSKMDSDVAAEAKAALAVLNKRR